MSSTEKTSMSSTLTSSIFDSGLASSCFASLASPFSPASFSSWPSSESFIFSSSSSFCSCSSFSSFSSFSSRRLFSACHFFFGSLHSLCFRRHSCSSRFQSANWSRNHRPGCRSSTRCVSLRSLTQTLRYSAQASLFCHSYLISSKPSSLVGRVKRPNCWLSSFFVRSWTADFRNHMPFSSSVSSAASSAFFTASSRLSSGSFFSSSASAAAPLGGGGPRLPVPPCSSWLRLRLTSATARCFFSWRANCCTLALCSSGGSPTTTSAVLRKSAASKLWRSCRRAPGRRLSRTSMTT
mmetsp:Transcript_66037/g.193259  ORF Transcript_66037/g.193259 Transcript_66037/m.193259 type:complete len:295 (-) Transcript_66037:1150-2034(-)